MKVVKESLFEQAFIQKPKLYETMEQARAVLRKTGNTEQDPKFQRLKAILLADNKIGYIGKFTKWLFQDGESFEQLMEVYELLKAHRTAVPPIHTFEKLEDLFDFLQRSEIEMKVSQVINRIPSMARRHADDRLRKLIEHYVEYAPQIADFYSKKGGRYKNPKDLYKDTEAFITNLTGEFSLDAILEKIKREKLNVKIIYASPEMLIIRPMNFKASNRLGSTLWCIQRSESYWKSYVDVLSTQYFIYDFSKHISDKRSMIGVTVNPDDTFKAAHFKDDTPAPHDYIKSL